MEMAASNRSMKNSAVSVTNKICMCKVSIQIRFPHVQKTYMLHCTHAYVCSKIDSDFSLTQVRRSESN